MSMSSFGFGSSDPFSGMLNKFLGMSPKSSPPSLLPGGEAEPAAAAAGGSADEKPEGFLT